MPCFGSRLSFGAAAVLALGAGLPACGQEGQTPSGGTGSGGSSTSSSSSHGSGGSGGGMVVPPKPLVILEWNTHNFLNDKNDSDPSVAPDEIVKSSSAYAAQRQAVGAVIAAMNPDIAVLAEVENQAVVDDLDATELAGSYGTKAVSVGNDPRGINVGFLSKLPIDEVVSHKDDSFTLDGTGGPPYTYSRDCLELHLVFNGRPVVILGVHFKAKTEDKPEKRLAEAQHTRAIADAIAAKDPGTAIVILGDYNDTPGSPPYQAIAGDGPGAFVDAADSVPEGEKWSFDFNGTLELIDHQMANPLLYDKLDPATVVIRHGSDVDDASDHAPVMATYQVN